MSTYYVAGIPYSDELYHHGIKGQKWGIRRFENEDGSLTPAGKERYRNSVKDGKVTSAVRSVKNKASNYLKDPERKARRENRKSLVKDVVNVHRMSDAELLEKIGRLEREVKLTNLTLDRLTTSPDPKKNALIQAGKKVAGAALAGIGAYAGYAIISGEFNPKSLASYMFTNPNKKKG